MGFWWILRFPVFLAILVSPLQPLLSISLTGPKMVVRGAAESRGTELSCLPLPLALPVLQMVHTIPLQINFFIFIRIIQILVSKLRAHQMRYTDYKFRWVLDVAHPAFPWCTRMHVHPVTPSHRLAKSTLTLIPLLGIHEVVFAFITDEHAQGTLRYVKLFFDLFLSSFQVSPALVGSALHGKTQSQEGLD